MEALKSKFKKAIESYVGLKITSIEIFPDPQVENTYAIRTKHIKEKENFDWLLCHYKNNWSIAEIENNLEECEYETWPPISNELKFF
jgi:hypothetical protein